MLGVRLAATIRHGEYLFFLIARLNELTTSQRLSIASNDLPDDQPHTNEESTQYNMKPL